MMSMDDESRMMSDIALYHETQAVQLLRKEIAEGVQLPRDELLFVVLLLSTRSNETPIVTQKKEIGAFRPPLTNLHNLEVGSSIRFGEVHRDILKTLVAQKGGVVEIVMPWLGEFFNTQAQYSNGTWIRLTRTELTFSKQVSGARNQTLACANHIWPA